MTPTDEKMQGEAIVLYDGVCNLCSRSARFIIRRDPAGRFRFAALQSDVGRRLLEAHGLPVDELTSIVLIEPERVSVKSNAALRIAGHLRGLWPLLGVLRLVPRPIRDWCYDVIANRRYHWFGRKQACDLPDDNIKDRFLNPS